MEAKKKRAPKKPTVDVRLNTIKEIQSKLNSLAFAERNLYGGALKNGKLDLSKLK